MATRAILFVALFGIAAAFVPPRAGQAPAPQQGWASLPAAGAPLAAAEQACKHLHNPPTQQFFLPSAAVVACGALAAGRRSRKSAATARRFFGGDSSPPPPVKVESYKDLEDPWLGSADLGFDPLKLSVGAVSGVFQGASTTSAAVYYNYRESEVKHGRFAMVAFLAIFAEAADRSALLSQVGVVGAVDRLDSTLGLDEVQAPVLLVGVGIQALVEYNKQREEGDDDFTSVEYTPDRCPGDLGFDPLGLGSGKGADLKGLHNIEVNTGRLAMIGITSFLFVEQVTLSSKAL